MADIPYSLGEPLPRFPKRTHASNETYERLGLQRFVTVAEAIDHIPAHCTDHDIPGLPKLYAISSTGGYVSNFLYADPITTGHTPNHYSQTRRSTVRQIACIQRFPYDHEFSGTIKEKLIQIGNAVPPTLARAIFEEIIRTLWKKDNM